MKAEGRRADGVSCDFIWVHGTKWRQGKRGWEGGRQPGGGAQRGGHGPPALLLPTPSLVLSMGPLPSGHPKEQHRLWVWVSRGLCAWENPCIGARTSVLSPTLGLTS